jgi:hypothetical protein
MYNWVNNRTGLKHVFPGNPNSEKGCPDKENPWAAGKILVDTVCRYRNTNNQNAIDLLSWHYAAREHSFIAGKKIFTFNLNHPI